MKASKEVKPPSGKLCLGTFYMFHIGRYRWCLNASNNWKGGKMMDIFLFVCRLVGLFSYSLSIADRFATYKDGKEKDPSGLTAVDGSKDK